MPPVTAEDAVEILLVEDNPGDAVLVRRVLAEITDRVRVTVAGDGERAMAMLRAGDGGERVRPDLILLDINLPRMSGHEVLAELKRDGELRRIPVVALTSSSAQEDIVAAYDHCINAYMTKRVDLGQYVEALRRLQQFWCGTVSLPPRPEASAPA
jgi:two-component system, chemotaxis family, response regulator Rcp1